MQFVLPSLARIQTDQACASGFFVDEAGHLATNWHAVKDAAQITIQTEAGSTHSARVVAGDAVNDLALLRVEGISSTPVEWGDSDSLRLGTSLVALGFPTPLRSSSCAQSATVTTGVFSTRTTLEGLSFLQTDTAPNPGNSGGPVAVLDGTAIGVTKAGAVGLENTNFLIPEARARPIIEAWLATIGAGEAPAIPVVRRSQIAFSSTRDGDFDIYVMDADGGNVRQLTNDPEWDASPSWSPDGAVLYAAGGSEGFGYHHLGEHMRRTERSDPTERPAHYQDREIIFYSPSVSDSEFQRRAPSGTTLCREVKAAVEALAAKSNGAEPVVNVFPLGAMTLYGGSPAAG